MVLDQFKALFYNEVERRGIPDFNIDNLWSFALDVHCQRYSGNMYPDIGDMLRLHTIVEIVDIFLHEYSNTHPEVRPFAYRLRSVDEADIVQLKQQIGRQHTPCYAPLTTLDFHINGSISICCHTKTYPIASYPENTIREAWFGKAMETFRKDLKSFTFPTPCTKCVHQIVSGQKHNSIQSLFDGDNLDSLIPDSVNGEMFKLHPSAFKEYYPTMFTFQLSDVCNYECIMCGGAFSSSIRKNREHRLPFKGVYDDRFVEQLREFIPHLKKVYFVGGEPLMTAINYKIMDLIAELNPNLHVFITTNGSVLNTRVKDLINKLPNLKFIISIDSLDPATYSLIRKNGNLESVMDNMEYLLSVERLQVLAVCPMIQNVYELPEILKWCEERGVDCWLQVVEFPLGGYIEGIHEFPKKDIPGYFNTKERSIDSNLGGRNLLPLVAFNTLDDRELLEIKNFLLRSKIPNQFRQQIDSLIHQLGV